MKPRFSILTLLGVTAYVAINVAALRSLQISAVARWLWWGLMFLVLIEATGRTTARTVFARGVLMSVLFAFAAVVFNQAHLYPLLKLVETGTDWLAGSQADEDVHHLAIEQTALVFGLLGGWLALGRYRVVERRARDTLLAGHVATDR